MGKDPRRRHCSPPGDGGPGRASISLPSHPFGLPSGASGAFRPSRRPRGKVHRPQAPCRPSQGAWAAVRGWRAGPGSAPSFGSRTPRVPQHQLSGGMCDPPSVPGASAFLQGLSQAGSWGNGPGLGGGRGGPFYVLVPPPPAPATWRGSGRLFCKRSRRRPTGEGGNRNRRPQPGASCSPSAGSTPVPDRRPLGPLPSQERAVGKQVSREIRGD